RTPAVADMEAVSGRIDRLTYFVTFSRPAPVESKKKIDDFCSLKVGRTMDGMVTITDKAKERIQQIMLEENYDSSYFVRVAVESGGCSGLNNRHFLPLPAQNSYCHSFPP